MFNHSRVLGVSGALAALGDEAGLPPVGAPVQVVAHGQDDAQQVRKHLRLLKALVAQELQNVGV